ncbi:hypothetical protein TUM20983_23460 [Mycobacterium antarcticum]|nr:hypothetical protein TUM20983_23460 [Mycolicibacterium sp. TUM20983]
MKAYRQDFIAIATLVTDGDPTRLNTTDITRDSMRTAFAGYARDHEAASIRRCWSTWNVLCTFLYTGEQWPPILCNSSGDPSWPDRCPRPSPGDLALILTSLLAGLRADELRKADGRHIRTTQVGAAVIHVKGEGGKERTVPIEADLLLVLDAYHQAQVQRIGVRPHALVGDVSAVGRARR